jgi:hypothetical protein
VLILLGFIALGLLRRRCGVDIEALLSEGAGEWLNRVILLLISAMRSGASCEFLMEGLELFQLFSSEF